MLKRFEFSKKFKKRFGSKVLVVLGCLILVVSTVFIAGIFRIKTININLENTPCVDSEALKNDLQLYNKSILLVNPTIGNDQLKQKYICIDKINFTKKYPSSIDVDVVGRKAAARLLLIKPVQKTLDVNLLEQLSSDSASQSATISSILADNSWEKEEASSTGQFLVDRSGVIFAQANDDASIPEINYYSDDLSLGKKVIDDQINNTLLVIEKLNSMSLPINKIKIFGDKLFIEGQPQVTFLLSKDIMRQVASLQLVLDAAKINSKTAESIDLRFEKAVVIYSSKK